MSLFGKRWEPDGRDTLSPALRLVLSIVVTGVMGFLLEYVGIEVLHAFQNTDPSTIYYVVAIWAFGLGPLLVIFRKASIIVPMVIVGVLFAFLVLFNHNYFIVWRLAGGVFHDAGVLWSPRIWEFSEGAIFGLTNPLLIALVAGAIETIVVPASVWTQKLLTLGLRVKTGVSVEDEEIFFQSSVGSRNELKPKRDFGFFFMRFIVVAYGGYLLYQIVGLLVHGKGLPLMSMFFFNPPETINTFMKILLMLSFATVGAFNADVRREAALLLLAGHLISVGASLWLYISYDPSPLFPADHEFLLASVAGDGVLIIVLLYLFLAPHTKHVAVSDIDLRSPSSILYRVYFLVFGGLFTLYTVGIIYFRVFASPESSFGAVFGGPDTLVSNSLTKYGTLAFLGFFLYRKPAMRKFFVPTLTLAFAVSLIATFVYGLMGSTEIITRTGATVTIPWYMTLHIIVDGGAFVLLLSLCRLYYHTDYNVSSLRPGSAECVMALHGALRTSLRDPSISSREVLKRVDEHIVSMKGRKRGLLSFPFWLVEYVFPLLLWARPHYSIMSVVEQRWMLRRYILRPHYERCKSTVPFMADFMYQIGDVVHALLTLAFYSSAQGQIEVKYVPPDARERLQADIPKARPPKEAQYRPLPLDKGDENWQKPMIDTPPPLLAPRVDVPTPSSHLPDEVDYCIVGSGAAGGVLAYRLAVGKGKQGSVCVLERGGYYTPSQDFCDDELKMIRLLYTEGGLQSTRSFDFTVLQAECVGGTTVVNNAICIEMPEISRNEWETFGIPVEKILPHYARVKQEIHIDVLGSTTVNKVVQDLFERGVQSYNNQVGDLGKISNAEVLQGNFFNCVGCGLCNIGCRRMRKMSVLETYIPWAQAHGATVFENMGAVAAESDVRFGKKRITSVIVRKPNGEFQNIRVRKGLVVAAGAIASSRFLMRSKIGGDGVGKFLSCNFALPPIVEFDEAINAFDGVQITMFAAPESYEAIFETSFNPPGAFSISMPVYFGRHATMMQSYTRAANFTALVGSDPTGTISRSRSFMFGRAIEWNQTENDLFRIRKALMTLVGIAKGAGAKRITLPTNPACSVEFDGSLHRTVEQFDRVVRHKRFINFVTAHPQGGNMMAADSFTERVVNLDFRVKDCENLFVCDASIFPRGIRVNPQWTIMALASLASERILELT